MKESSDVDLPWIQIVCLVSISILLSGCPTPRIARPYPEPTAAQVTARLAEARAMAVSFQAGSVMDYWLGKQRVKGTVLVMGTPGAKVRLNALSPAGGSVLADLACDGQNFVYVDHQNQCQLVGPCNSESIASLLGVPLAPEDFFFLALGQTPVLADAQGTLRWDEKKGHELVELRSSAGTQSLVLDGRSGQWDVLSSELRTPDGKVVWSVRHTGFGEAKTTDGKSLRVPSKSKFLSPDTKADLEVDWEERRINVALGDEKFRLAPPVGLAACR